LSTADAGESLRQRAQQECGAIADALASSSHPHEAIHAARKAIRRLRALLALLDHTALEVRQVDRQLQRLGDGLSRIRDAHVVLEAARLLQRGDAAVPWDAVIEALAQRRQRLLLQLLQDDPGFARRLRVVAAVRERLDAQPWQQVRGKQVRLNLERSVRRADKAAARARQQDDAEAVHRWRRRVRRLRMQRDIVHDLGLHGLRGRAHDAARPSCRALHRLSDALGWQQDLRLLRNLVRAMPASAGKPRVMQQIDAVAETAMNRAS